MLIDKTKFVALVGAIATSTACLIVSDDDDKKRNNDDGGDTTSASTTSTDATGSTTKSASSGDTSSSASSGGGGGGGSAGCLDDQGAPGACTGECEGFTTCDALASVTLGVGEDLVPCLNALDSATCSIFTDARGTCLFDSLAKACDDIEAPPLCTEIAAGCGTVDDAAWQDLCTSRLNGLTVAARPQIVACAKESCEFSPTALDDCLINLFYPVQ